MEDVAGAGGVDDRDLEGGGVEKAVAVPGEDAVFAQGGGGEGAAEARLHLEEGLFEVRLGHEAAGKVTAGDEEVDIAEKIFDAGIELVEVGDDRDAGGAGPGRGDRGGGGVVAIDVESAGGNDPVAVEIGGLQDEAIVAPAEDGAFAAAIDEDDGLSAGAAGNGEDARFDAGMGEGVAMDGGGVVFAEFTDVAGLQTPALAGDDGGGHLAAGKNADVAELDLGAADGEVDDGDDCVCGVEANADEIDHG